MGWQHLLDRPNDRDFGLISREEVFAVHSARPAQTAGNPYCCHAGDVEISFLLDGNSSIWVAGEPRTLVAGQYHYVPPGVPHSTKTGDRGTEGVYVQVPIRVFRDARAELGGQLWSVSRPEARPISSDLGGIVHALKRQMEAPDQDQMVEALGIYLAGYLIEERCDGAPLAIGRAAGHEVALRRVVEQMRSCCEDPLTLDDLARAAELSKFRLAHVFKDRFGLTPYRYLERIRAHKAAIRLRARGMTVSEVAYQFGFPSSSRFAQVFRREFGVLPSAWQGALAP